MYDKIIIFDFDDSSLLKEYILLHIPKYEISKASDQMLLTIPRRSNHNSFAAFMIWNLITEKHVRSIWEYIDKGKIRKIEYFPY